MTKLEQTHTFAVRAFEGHQITELLRSGVYRHWRCGRPESVFYEFSILTVPGRLLVTGDVGNLLVEREYDMLAWARKAAKDIDYFAGKVVSVIPTREFEPELVRSWASAQLLEDLPSRYQEVLRRLLKDDDFTDAHTCYDRTRELWSGGDPPNWHDWTANLLWCREALLWFLAHHDEPTLRREPESLPVECAAPS